MQTCVIFEILKYCAKYFTDCGDVTSMKANIGSTPFHSWQSGDKVDEHLASCVLLSQLVDFIYGRISKTTAELNMVEQHSVAHVTE